MTSTPDPFSAPPPEGSQPAWGPAPGWDAAPPPQPGYGTPPQSWGPDGPPARPGEETVWAVLAHLSFFVVAVLGPLVIYLIKKDDSPFSRHHAAEALNFHLTLTIAAIVSALLVIVLIGILLLLAVAVFGVVCTVIAAVKAGQGRPYRYPLTFHFVS